MVAELLDVEEVLVRNGDLAHLPGNLEVALHRAAQRGDLASAVGRRRDDLLHAVDVAGEAADDDALALLVTDDVEQVLADHPLGLGEPVGLGVGGVGQQQADAVLLADGTDLGEIGGASVDRREVDLEIARVVDDALGRVEGDADRVGHGVTDRHHLDVERPNGAALAVVQRVEAGAPDQPGLLDAAAGQVQRELGGVEREGDLAQ